MTPQRTPTKAFQRNPSLENEFYIAQKLGWRSVREMRRGLGQLEYVQWVVYFGRRKQDEELAAWKSGR